MVSSFFSFSFQMDPVTPQPLQLQAALHTPLTLLLVPSPCHPRCSMHSLFTRLPCPGSPSPRLTCRASVLSFTSSVNAAMLYACRIILSQSVSLWGLCDCMMVSRIESLDFFPSQGPFLASITVDHHVDK